MSHQRSDILYYNKLTIFRVYGYMLPFGISSKYQNFRINLVLHMLQIIDDIVPIV